MSDLNNLNIEEYLKKHENKELLRFITCGSVDDGKSTLIGRLLYDSKMIFEDQLNSIEKDSKKHGTQNGELDLALLVDGLQSEREQGITIDVAYRFFSTDKRKFIIADTPGHEQYTRNMATGASTANLAIILIDARYGLQTQTKRHSFIVNLLGIKSVIIAINKMDLINFSQKSYEQIKNDYLNFAQKLNIKNIHFIPVSALNGDNVVNLSKETPWYKDKSLIELLDNIYIYSDFSKDNFRFPVQYVNRPNLNFRGFCGIVASGEISVGDEIVILPSKKITKVKEIIPPSIPINLKNENLITINRAYAPMSITITTEDEVDISRGDMIIKKGDICKVSNNLDVMVVWMSEIPVELNNHYLIKFSSSLITAKFTKIYHQIDVNTLEKLKTDKLELNEIGLLKLILTKNIPIDKYEDIKQSGAFIIIDRFTNATLGAVMVKNINSQEENIDSFESELNELILKYYPNKNTQKLSKKILELI